MLSESKYRRKQRITEEEKETKIRKSVNLDFKISDVNQTGGNSEIKQICLILRHNGLLS